MHMAMNFTDDLKDTIYLASQLIHHSVRKGLSMYVVNMYIAKWRKKASTKLINQIKSNQI